MITVVATYENGFGKSGARDMADAERTADRARKAGAITVRIMVGPQLPAIAVAQQAKYLAKMLRTNGTHREAAPHWAATGVNAADANFDDDFRASTRARSVVRRWARFCDHIRDTAPGWVDVQRINYADNSIVMLQRATRGPKAGETREKMLVGPGGDACF